MNLWEIQNTAVDLLEGYAPLAGVPVLANDGGYPKLPSREAGLQDKGLILVVWDIDGGDLVDESKTGVSMSTWFLPVLIEENPKSNEAAAGLGIPWEKALEHVLEVFSSQEASREGFRLLDPRADNLSKVNGINRVLVNVAAQVTIAPAHLQ